MTARTIGWILINAFRVHLTPPFPLTVDESVMHYEHGIETRADDIGHVSTNTHVRPAMIGFQITGIGWPLVRRHIIGKGWSLQELHWIMHNLQLIYLCRLKTINKVSHMISRPFQYGTPFFVVVDGHALYSVYGYPETLNRWPTNHSKWTLNGTVRRRHELNFL
jgi:hypothetical protein